MGHLHSGSLSGGPDGYYVLKPSRQNSRLGRREPHTIHQMTMLHSVDTSIARSHLKGIGGGGRDEKKNQKQKLLVYFKLVSSSSKGYCSITFAMHFLLSMTNNPCSHKLPNVVPVCWWKSKQIF